MRCSNAPTSCMLLIRHDFLVIALQIYTLFPNLNQKVSEKTIFLPPPSSSLIHISFPSFK